MMLFGLGRDGLNGLNGLMVGEWMGHVMMVIYIYIYLWLGNGYIPWISINVDMVS